LPSPAESLDNMVLPNDWVVVGRARSATTPTGAFFSVGYVVESATTGQRAFLKALNFERILDGADEPIAALQDALGVFRFEREVCHRCRGMDRVVTILDSGDIRTDPANPLTLVPYLIFEEATGDVRAFLESARDLDIAWALRSLHQIANGLLQLHQVDIAHQDLKPSNVLIFGRDVSKVADLGRASNRSVIGPFDEHQLAGAVAYAPPELLYGEVSPDFNQRRLACDVYLLGSMLTFFFSGVGTTALLMNRIESAQRPVLLGGGWTGDYRAVLPLVQSAFGEMLAEFAAAVPSGLRNDLTSLLRELCDPDPTRRGNSRERSSKHGNPFALDYFVSRINALASRAEARVRFR
jgi:serine/threonine protein kinase